MKGTEILFFVVKLKIFPIFQANYNNEKLNKLKLYEKAFF